MTRERGAAGHEAEENGLDEDVVSDTPKRRDPASGTPRMRSTRTASLEQIKDWAGAAAGACWEKGGEETVILRVGETLAITDAFVITAAANARQVRTIAEEVEARVKAAGGPAPESIEGLRDAAWVLMDYGDFVVHVMLAETRGFYQLDQLWADAQHWEWDRPEVRVAGE